MDSNKQQLNTATCSKEFNESPRVIKFHHNGSSFAQIEYHFQSPNKISKVLTFEINSNKMGLQLDVLELETSEFISSIQVHQGKQQIMQIRFILKNRTNSQIREFVANSALIKEEGEIYETFRYENITELPICLFQVTLDSVITQFTCEFVSGDSSSEQTQIMARKEGIEDVNVQMDMEKGDNQQILEYSNQIIEALCDEGNKHIINYQSLKKLRQMFPDARQLIDQIIENLNKLRQYSGTGVMTLLNMDDSFRDILLRMQELLGSRSEFNLAVLSSFASERKRLVDYRKELDELINNLRGFTKDLSGLSNLKKTAQTAKDEFISEEDFKKAEDSILNQEGVIKGLIEKQMETLKIQSQNTIEISSIDYRIARIIEDSQNTESSYKHNREQKQKLNDELKSMKPQERTSDPQTQSNLQEELMGINEEEKKEQEECRNQLKQQSKKCENLIHSIDEQIQKQEIYTNQFTKIHSINVFDESTSMQASWPTIQKIHLKFAADMNTIGSQHLVTTIMFSDLAEITHKKLPASNIGSLRDLRGGGTNFAAAFQCIIEAIEFTPQGYTPIVQFVTDGQDTKADFLKLQDAIKQIKEKAPTLKLFATGIGPKYNSKFLNEICQLANGSSILQIRETKISFFNDAKDASALEQIFQQLTGMYEIDFEEKKKNQIRSLLFQYETEFNIKKQKIKKFYDSQRADAQERDEKRKLYLNSESEENEGRKLKWMTESIQSLEENEGLDKDRLEQLHNTQNEFQIRKDEIKHANVQLEFTLKKYESEILQESQNLATIKEDWNTKKLQNYKKSGCTTAEQMRNLNQNFQSISEEIQILKNIATNFVVLYEGSLKQLNGIIKSQDEILPENLDKQVDKTKLHMYVLYHHKSKFQKQLKDSPDLNSTIRILLEAKNEKKFPQLEPYFQELYGKLDEKLAFIALTTSEDRSQFVEDLAKKIVPTDETASTDFQEENNEQQNSNEIEEEFKFEKELNQSQERSSDLNESKIMENSKSIIISTLSQPEEVQFLKHSNKKVDFENLKTIEQVQTRMLSLQAEIKVQKQKERKSRTAVEKKQIGQKLKLLTKNYEFCKEIQNESLVTGRIDTLIGLVKDIIEGPMIAQLREQKFKGLQLQFTSICKITQPRLPFIKELNQRLSIEDINMLRICEMSKNKGEPKLGQLQIKYE